MVIIPVVLASLVNPALHSAPAEQFTEKIPGTTVSFDMIQIPAGSVEIGGKTVPIKSLFVAKTELTWDVFDIWAFRMDQTQAQQAAGTDAASRPSKPYGAPDRGFGHSGYPALSMTFPSAKLFCNWLSAKTKRKYRLMTEAEYAYAAGGGGNLGGTLGEIAWTRSNSQFKTHSVGKKKANGFGLHDMLGNAGEWAVASDGTGVLMGGTFLDTDDKVSPFTRALQVPKWNQTDPQNPKSKWWLSDGVMVGMRIVCEQ